MTDAPERIWIDPLIPSRVALEAFDFSVPYRRADLPPTLAEAMTVPEVRAFIARAEDVLAHYKIVHQGSHLRTTGQRLLSNMEAALAKLKGHTP